MEKNKDFTISIHHFNGVPVRVVHIEGRDYVPGVDLGMALGFADPTKAVQNLYARNKEELEPHTRTLTMRAQGDGHARPHRVFDETGAYLLAMFGQSPAAKELRVWLARLPGHVRELKQAITAALPEGKPIQLPLSPPSGLSLGFGINALLGRFGLSSEDFTRYCNFRYLGLYQAEAAGAVGLTVEQAKRLEHEMKPFKLFFPDHGPANARIRRMTENLPALFSRKDNHVN